jgi:hypothetical protein
VDFREVKGGSVDFFFIKLKEKKHNALHLCWACGPSPLSSWLLHLSRLTVFVASKPIDVVLLREKNIIPWLISSREHGVKSWTHSLSSSPHSYLFVLSPPSMTSMRNYTAGLRWSCRRASRALPATDALWSSTHAPSSRRAPTTNAPTSKRGEELCVTVLCRLVARILTAPVSSMRWCRAPQ